jgi:hypothetical protein
MPYVRRMPLRHSQDLAAARNVGRCYRLFERCGYSVLSFLHPEWTVLVSQNVAPRSNSKRPRVFFSWSGVFSHR